MSISHSNHFFRLHPESFGFTVLIGTLTALPALATDMSLPALGGMADSLGATEGDAALTLSLFLVGYALGPVGFGPLSDNFGRRPVVIFGCALFAAAAVFGTLAGSMPVLLLWRFVQGAGGGAATVISLAVVRDLFEGAALRRRLSQISVIRVITPMIAPSLGALVMPFGGWRAIYAVTAAFAVVLLVAAVLALRETAPRFSGAPHVPLRLVASYARVLGNRLSLGYSLVNASAFGCLFAYINGSSLVMMEVFGLSPRVFGLLFAVVDLGLMAGFFLNGRLNAKGIARSGPLVAGLVLGAGASAALFGLALAGLAAPASLVPVLTVGAFGYGLITPNATQGALQPVPEVAGVASAVLSLAMMLAGAAAGAIVAALYDGRTALAMTGVMAAFSAGALLLYAGYVRPGERRVSRSTKA